MLIRLTALSRVQVQEVIKLAEFKAAKVTLEKIAKPGDLSPTAAADSALQKLVTVIDKLPPTAKRELMTLMWLGMGTIDADQSSWAELLQAAHDEQINDIPERLALIPRLHEFLHRGLEKANLTGKAMQPACGPLPRHGVGVSPKIDHPNRRNLAFSI
jgi:hypothetical protein